jgi:glycine/D-amino acid oxidase-like deaminating enzyme
MIWNSAEGQVDTGRMMDALMRLATSMGIRIHTGINVTRIEEDENGIELMTAEEFRMSCRHLLLATNGFTGKLVNGLDVAPARAQVLMTKPIDGLQVKGCFHYQEGYYYFRNVGDRILLGGARNTDLKTEYTDQMKLTDKIQDHLEGFLATYVLPGKKYEIDLRWSGVMGLGQDKSPILKRLTERSWCAVRMGGMGVAIGTTAGKDLARLFMKDHG